MNGGLIRYRTAELPDIQFWLTDGSSALLDLSASYTFEIKVGRPGSASSFTKTTGLTGAVGSGTSESSAGVPNLVATFTAGELDVLTRGRTTLQIKATTGGRDRFWQCALQVLDVIT
jgi:hypothetical protein